MGQNIINSFTTVCNFIRPYDQLAGLVCRPMISPTGEGSVLLLLSSEHDVAYVAFSPVNLMGILYVFFLEMQGMALLASEFAGPAGATRLTRRRTCGSISSRWVSRRG